MDFYEMICFAKVYNVACGLAHPSTVSKIELDIATEALKKIADNRYDWSQEQKDLYKLIVDATKNAIEGN